MDGLSCGPPCRWLITNHLCMCICVCMPPSALPSTQLASNSPFITAHTSAFVGDIDEDKDASLDYSEIKAEPLHEVNF